MKTAALLGCGISIALASVVVGLSTLNVLASVICMVSIGGICAVAIGFITAANWTFGFAESVSCSTLLRYELNNSHLVDMYHYCCWVQCGLFGASSHCVPGIWGSAL